MTAPLIRPDSVAALQDAVRAAVAAKTPLEIVGGGSRSGLGDPVQAETRISTGALDAVTLYEPGELTLVVQAGAPVAAVEALLAANNQMLAFEPMDHRALYGDDGDGGAGSGGSNGNGGDAGGDGASTISASTISEPTIGEPTIGAVAAANISGPRRIAVGACRDMLLGTSFVNGAGDLIKAGGRVMKNVTGYDLTRLLAGSHGSLGIITEVALKVASLPETEVTLTIATPSPAAGVAALCAAFATPYEPSGAAWTPESGLNGGFGAGRAYLRIAGFEASVADRVAKLTETLASHGAVDSIAADASRALWRDLRDARPIAAAPGVVWRVSVPPADGPKVLAALADLAPAAFLDWSGGLVWLRLPEDASDVDIRPRLTAAGLLGAPTGGHATLIRATAADRARIPAFQPQPETVATLQRSLKRKFDPAGLLNPGRMV